MFLDSDIIRRELERRLGSPESRIVSSAFAPQRACLLDPSKRVVACCTRKSAKTYSGWLRVLKQCYEQRSRCLYVFMTRAQGLATLPDIATEAKEKLTLDYEYTNGEWRFPNGSVCTLFGTDSSENRKDVLRGPKLNVAVVDEMQSYTTDTRQLIEAVLGPQVAAVGGSMLLLGTPDRIVDTYWHRLATNREPGWSVHSWSWKDNPYVCQNISEWIDEQRKIDPTWDSAPNNRREYYGEWVADVSDHVYTYVSDTFVNDIPDSSTCLTLIGLDTGYTAPSAIVVGRYDYLRQVLWIVHVEQRANMDMDDLGKRLTELSMQYCVSEIVVDPNNAALNATLRNRYNLPLTDAYKHGKEQHIETLNSDFRRGRVKIFKEEGGELLKWTYDRLVWKIDPEKRKRVEDRRTPNHVSDAMLYLHGRVSSQADIGVNRESSSPSDERSLQLQRVYEEIATTNNTDTWDRETFGIS